MTSHPVHHRLLSGIDRRFRVLEVIAMAGAAVCLVAVMILVTVDATMRYAFNSPLTFQYALTEGYLMVAIMTLPLAWGFRTGGYIRIMALLNVFPPFLRNSVLRIGLLVSAFYAFLLALFSGFQFVDVFERGEVQMGVIDWPVSWSWVCIPIGLGLLALRLLIVALGPTESLHSRHDEVGEDGV